MILLDVYDTLLICFMLFSSSLPERTAAIAFTCRTLLTNKLLSLLKSFQYSLECFPS